MSLKREEENAILFVGPTGSGKSHMIDILAKTQGKRSSAGLQSHTKSISTVTVRKSFEASADEKEIILVDTPGFNDTYDSDMKTLRILSKWLAKRYKAGWRIRGIIYLHRITDNRISEAVHRNLHVFSELCGPEAVKRTLLVTTMWDEIQWREGEVAEEEIKRSLWAGMIAGGASVARSAGDEKSAWDAVKEILQKTSDEGKAPLKLSLQEEALDRKKKLWETRAAQALYTPLSVILAEHAGRNDEDRNGPRSIADLNQEFEKLQSQVNELFEKYPGLHATVGHKLFKFIRDALQKWAGKANVVPGVGDRRSTL